MGIFSKFGFGLKKTREGMTERIEDVLGAYEEITDDFYDDLEEALIMGDIGMKTAVDIVDALEKQIPVFKEWGEVGITFDDSGKPVLRCKVKNGEYEISLEDADVKVILESITQAD